MARSVISIQEGGRSFGDWIKKHSKGIARVTVATHTVSRPVTDANGKVIDHRPFHLSSSEYLGHILTTTDDTSSSAPAGDSSATTSRSNGSRSGKWSRSTAAPSSHLLVSTNVHL
jgi:hypothetical protein